MEQDSGTIVAVAIDKLSSSLNHVKLSRRSMLAGLLGIPALAALSACSPGKHNEPDPLNDLLDAARHDLAIARRISGSQSSVQQVITVRQAHVDAIKEEIERQAELWEEPTKSPTKRKVPKRSSVEQLRTSLAESAQQALDVVSRSSGYRAGLCGSIGASCAALQGVVLA